MLRRKFLQSIGAAILGTAIALKVPDVLVPTINEYFSSPEDVFGFLDEQMNQAMKTVNRLLDEQMYGTIIRDKAGFIEIVTNTSRIWKGVNDLGR